MFLLYVSKLGISTSHPNGFILVGNRYSLGFRAFNFHAQPYLFIPSSTIFYTLVAKTSTQKQWMEIPRGLMGPSGSLKSTSRPPQQPDRFFVHEKSPCEVSATWSTPTGSVKVSFFFFWWNLVSPWSPSIFLTFSSCVSLYFSEARNRFHQWLCPNRILAFFFGTTVEARSCGMITFHKYPRCLWWFLKQARFRPRFGSWKNEWKG